MKKNWLPWLLGLVLAAWFVLQVQEFTTGSSAIPAKDTSAWVGPGKYQLKLQTDTDKLIAYGRELIEHTSVYLGPKGTVKAISNGMNCQNCHLDAGTKPFGNNYSAVYSTYPKFRERSGNIETIYKRINDCFERSLNGMPLDTTSHEMQAIYAYMQWLGKDVKKNEKPTGSGIMDIPLLDRAADPAQGKTVYGTKCQSCHGSDGQGQINVSLNEYVYPPLWGPHSYNSGAGLFRLSRLAGYIINNMPQGTVYHAPQLSNAEAWDVAAFINAQPRPSRDMSKDWPDISKKPFDHPFGPYADTFSIQQHKYGPFAPVKQFIAQLAEKKPETR